MPQPVRRFFFSPAAWAAAVRIWRVRSPVILQAPLGPARDDLGKPQGGGNVKPQRSHLETGG